MRFSPFPFFYIVLAAVLLLAQGCTTLVADVKKQPGYSKQIKKAQLSWTYTKGDFAASVQNKARYDADITPEIRESSLKVLKEGVRRFREELLGLVAADMKKSGVVFHTKEEEVDVHLVIRPVAARAQCYEGYCHRIRFTLKAELYDYAEQQQVWSGTFTVKMDLQEYEKALLSFTETLTKELRNAELLSDKR